MNRKRLFVIGVLALTLAFVFTAVTTRVMRSRTGTAGGPVLTAVVVADRDLPLGKEILSGDVRIVQLPANDLPLGTMHSPSAVVGRGVIVDMARNEPILVSKIAGPNEGAGLPPRIRHGMRALAVKVNEVVAVAGFIKAGSRVDVLLTGNISPNNDPAKIETTTVLENVSVLAVNQEMHDKGDGKPTPDASVVTLLVTPEDAEKLTLASTHGRIQLALRNPLDVDQANPPAVLNPALYGIPIPVAVRRMPHKQPAVIEPPREPDKYAVEIIRGEKRDEIKF